MRTLVLLAWLMMPIAAGAYHFGPGQDQLRLDDTAQVLAEADRQAAAGNAESAVELYNQALSLLPGDRTDVQRRVRVSKAQAQLQARALPDAHGDLKVLVAEMEADPKADAKTLADAKLSLANAQYYVTWLMRLEGLPEADWEPEIDSARQLYRLLAENAETAGNAAAADERREDLESAVRLARMDVGELQGMSLPKQCQGCKSGQCKGKKPGNKPAKNKPKDARGASSGPPPDKSGS